jgi:hypothetical protein
MTQARAEEDAAANELRAPQLNSGAPATNAEAHAVLNGKLARWPWLSSELLPSSEKTRARAGDEREAEGVRKKARW